MFRWKRPQVGEFPQVYARFEARDAESDDVVKYWIQDLPPERYEEARDFMLLDQYLKEETFAKGTGEHI